MDRAQYVARCAELMRLPLQADSRPPRLRLIPLVDAEQAMALREAAEHYAEPVLSSERDTRDTDRPLAPHVDWAKP